MSLVHTDIKIGDLFWEERVKAFFVILDESVDKHNGPIWTLFDFKQCEYDWWSKIALNRALEHEVIEKCT